MVSRVHGGIVKHIGLRFGTSPSRSHLEFEVSPITIFVGPNYSGKSMALNEIFTRCTQHGVHQNQMIVEDIEFHGVEPTIAAAIIDQLRPQSLPNQATPRDHILVGAPIRWVPEGALLQALLSPNTPNLRDIYVQYLTSKVLVLTGTNRITLINQQPAGDLQATPTSSFQRLFHDDDLRRRLSAIIHRAFGLYLAIDPTNLGALRLRLSKTQPQSTEIERGLTAASVEFHRAATDISATSDGAKAFVGVLTEILTGDPDVLLIDEPEAFLHPALTHTLGNEIANTLATTRKQIFAATHSPQFLTGCIQSGLPVNVVRLTYRDGVASARLLPSAELTKLMRNPLLRSIGVLSGLFYESVVVTEGDPDRAFYQEINERMLRAQGNGGIPNCLFLNAQNKQTIPTIVAALRRLGIPAASVYDIDMVKDGGSTATSYLESGGVPELSRQPLTQMRAAVLRALEESGRDFKTCGGIDLLAKANREAACNYFDQLENYGVFVVRCGELESWLKSLGVSGHGPSWLVEMFERIGEDPNEPEYFSAGTDDVWKFMDHIRAWLLDPIRKGIPD